MNEKLYVTHILSDNAQKSDAPMHGIAHTCQVHLLIGVASITGIVSKTQ